MKRFIVKAMTVVVITYGSLLGILFIRCLCSEDMLEKSLVTPAGADVLLLGSSCVGCSTIESNCFGIATIWQYRSPPQLSLMRLLELERQGELGKFRKVCLELGYQNFAYQTQQWMKDLFLQTLPMSWRHLDLTGIPTADLFVHFVHNFNSKFELRSNNPFSWEDNVSAWSQERKERDWAGLRHAYFDVLDNKSVMIDNWPAAIERSIVRVAGICKRHNIECEIVVFPISSYCRNRIPEAAEDRLRGLMDFSRKQGLRVRDYRAASPDSDFLNLNHLSRRGAESFMKMLAFDD